ncbi:MAG: hypothetical protein HOP21_05730 [Methylotenera sp.]|nr:hypothetical protein [Methylotenera sp.]
MKQSEKVIFKRIDMIFWGLWLLAPFLLWQAIHFTWTMPYYPFGDEVDCARGPAAASFSALGQGLVALAFVMGIGFYAALIILMHRLVRCFKRGEMLISATLDTINKMAWIFIAIAVISILHYNLNLYLLYRLGDLPKWQPFYTLDMLSIALGLMLFGLRILIQHAIVLQEDMNLTV